MRFSKVEKQTQFFATERRDRDQSVPVSPAKDASAPSQCSALSQQCPPPSPNAPAVNGCGLPMSLWVRPLKCLKDLSSSSYMVLPRTRSRRKQISLKPQFRRLHLPALDSMSATAASTPMVQLPRPSASLVIVNERNEVLLVHRNPQARHFGGVHVGAINILL